MPELPEVETLRLQLSQLIIGLTIKDIEILNPKSFIGGKRLILGKKIIGVRRFAKILVIDLADGLSLAVHLKMSGQLICSLFNIQHLTYNKKIIDSLLRNLPNKHTRVIITFTNRDRLFFNDMRKFGWLRIVRNKPINQLSNNPIDKLEDLNNLIKHLGPEPLKDLTLKKFRNILSLSNRPIKLVLMDQEKISGVGNIYANDALFLAKIHPKTPANKISKKKTELFYEKLLKVLTDGIRWGGASRNHFRNVFGRKGQVQEHFHVYDREGKMCLNKCGEKIVKIKLGGRGTFYCPKCQS